MESGVRTVRDYTWQQLLQVDSCTWCGKCQEACPGHATGFPLSPRNLVQAIDSQLLRTRWKGNGDTPSLHGTLVKPEEALVLLHLPGLRGSLSGVRPATAPDHRPSPAPG